MDWTASAIKPGRRSLNRTSMDVRRARGAIKDPRHALCHDVVVRGCRPGVVNRYWYEERTTYGVD